MPKTKKIAISLPVETFRKIEKARKKSGETRSAYICRNIEYVFSREEKDALIKQYIEGYTKYPETEEEKSFVEATSKEILSKEPW